MAKKTQTKKEKEEALELMVTPKFKGDIVRMIKSRYPLFYVTTIEETRFLTYMEAFCEVNNYKCFRWDAYNGIRNISSGEEENSSEDMKDNPTAILDHIIKETTVFKGNKSAIKKSKEEGVNGVIFILLDYFRFINENAGLERRLKEIVENASIVSTIVTGPIYVATETTESIMPVLDFPYANKHEIKKVLYDLVAGVKKKIPTIEKDTKQQETELVNSVSGLTLLEAQTAYSKSIVAKKRWDIATILEEKKQIISKSGLLEYFDKVVPISQVGGLKKLVQWIENRKLCFSDEAREYGIDMPRGLLTIGMPGCVLPETKIKVKKVNKEGKYKIYRCVSENLPACRGG